MRGTIPGLASPAPLGSSLPGLLQDDDALQAFTAGLDEVLAPVLNTLDNIEAYLDPRLAPSDFVAWLAGWVGLALDENWPLSDRREAVAAAVEAYQWRGTRMGLALEVALYAGVEPEIEDSGGSYWGQMPKGALPMGPPRVTVTVRVPEDAPVDAGRLDRIVAEIKPAHVAHEVEVVRT